MTWALGTAVIGAFALLGPASPPAVAATAAPAAAVAADPWRHVDAGVVHACGIRAASPTGGGSLWCWGNNAVGQLGTGTTTDSATPVRVGTGATWVTVAAAKDQAGAHSCGVLADGTLWCWGGNDSGQLGDGTTIDRPTPVRVGSASDWATVSAGGKFTCGTRTDGTLWCWGVNHTYQLGDGTSKSRLTPTRIGAAGAWSDVSAGLAHTCGVQAGSLWCWGYNSSGQLGDGTDETRQVPTEIGVSTGWATVSAGYEHTCAVATGHTLWCWGLNFAGQIGGSDLDDAPGQRRNPAQIGTRTDWAGAATGPGHSCATRTDGTLWCWGDNGEGQLGDDTQLARATAARVGADVTTWSGVAAGGDYNCATRTDGTLWCWGTSVFGLRGDGRSDPGLIPVQVGNAAGWTQVAANFYHSCAVKSDGSAWCWGWNAFGQLGDATTTDGFAPVRVSGGTTWAQVALGGGQSCGLDRGAALWCWGRNPAGGGDPAESDSAVPVRFGTATWRALSGGNSHMCGIQTDGTLWCWGLNGGGQLGLENVASTADPVQVGTDSTWSSVAAGGQHTCATRSDGSLWCWGSNSNGQLGIGEDADGKTHPSATPVRVGTATTWARASSGVAHTCGLRTDGTLWCWGSNDNGRLGTNSSSRRTSPAAVAGGGTWADLTTTWEHTCALASNHSLRCWGANMSGQLGNGTIDDQWEPAPTAAGDATWSSAGAGYRHSCGVRSEGTLWCWGEELGGLLGAYYPALHQVP